MNSIYIIIITITIGVPFYMVSFINNYAKYKTLNKV